jgi:hypothetical protein
MEKSPSRKAVDEIQRALRLVLKPQGFRARDRTFNRTTTDGLTQVIGIQMWPSDPPGTTYVPGLRENRHGLFTINLGVYVPEVAVHHAGSAAKSWVQDVNCCVRSRLGEVCNERTDLWWLAVTGAAIVRDLTTRLQSAGVPFLERFATRDRILTEWKERSESWGASSPPRIVCAIILTARDRREEARHLLSCQARETRNPGHPAYVRGLAARLGLGTLDG